MTSLTDNPALDTRTRNAIAAIEVETNQLLAANNPPELATHLINLVAWQKSIQQAIVANDAELNRLTTAPTDDPLVIVCEGLRSCFAASLSAATELRSRVESQLATVHPL